MKPTTTTLLLLSLALPAGCGSPPPAEQSVPVSPTVEGLRPPASHAPRPGAFDVEHYALDLVLLPERRRLEGVCRIRFYATEPDVERVSFDLAGMQVARIVDASGAELAFDHFNGELAVTLARPLARGDYAEVAVHYAGEPARGLWFVGGRRVPTHVFTQGECEDSRWWFPCWDAPSDRATSELRVTMPSNWTSVAAGELIDSSTDGTRRTDHWRMVTPHPTYLTTLVAGDLTTVRAEWQGLPLSYIAPDRYSVLLEESLGATPQALEFLAELAGKRYPYSKYSTACVENFPYGGMENISATTLTTACLRDESGRRDEDAVDLLVHEAAHQWFGNLLTCRDWSEVWLNEGFATYAALLFRERTLGTDIFRARMAVVLDEYLEQDRGANRRPIVSDVYREPMDLFGKGHVYAGGATRLHLLRFLLGDQAFFAGLKRYVGANQGRAVTTADFQRSMEAASGLDLSTFFEQWLHSPGYPQFEVRWRWDRARKRVLLTVHQTHEVGRGSPEAFVLPVAVEVRDASRSTMHRIQIDQRRQMFELAATREPKWVRFDKGGWVPCRVDAHKSIDEWLAITQSDDDVTGRLRGMRALSALIAEGDEGTRRRASYALLTRLEGDGVPAVRAAAAEALASAGGREALEILAHTARNDPEPVVRMAALQGLEAWGVSPVLADVGRDVYREGLSYATMGAAAGLLTVADPHGAYDWLQAQALEEPPPDALRVRLLPQIARLSHPEVLGELRAWALDRSAGPEVRAEAVAQLSRLARGDAQVRAELISLLESRYVRVRLAAVEALVEFGDEESIAALVEYYPSSVLTRERRAIEKVYGTRPALGG